MAVFLSPVGGAGAQFFDNNGNPLTGGKLYTYAAGTTTPQATYTSSAGSVFHSNPIILDAAGRVSGSSEIWLTDSAIYKFVLKTSDDVLLATWDQITGVNSNFVNYTTETEVQTATDGQTVFTLTTMSYQPATGSLTVFVDGVNQYEGTSYLETDSTTVTFLAGLHVGALVKFTTAVQTTGNATDASVVTYDPPFTGSVATTVQDKLTQYVSVKDFGAVGDGITDDTVAFESAIKSVADNGGTVYVPGGTYLVDVNADWSGVRAADGFPSWTTFTRNKAFTIRGDGGLSILKAKAGGRGYALRIAYPIKIDGSQIHQHNIRLMDFEVDVNGEKKAIELVQVKSPVVERLNIYGGADGTGSWADAFGLGMFECGMFRVTNLNITGGNWLLTSGIFVNGLGSADGAIVGCDIGGYAIGVQINNSPGDIMVRGNVIYNQGVECVRIDCANRDCGQIRMIDNHFGEPAGDMLNLNTGSTSYAVVSTIISNNFFWMRNTKGSGIVLGYSLRTEIGGNIFGYIGGGVGSGKAAIRINPNASRWHVHHNIIERLEDGGIGIDVLGLYGEVDHNTLQECADTNTTKFIFLDAATAQRIGVSFNTTHQGGSNYYAIYQTGQIGTLRVDINRFWGGQQTVRTDVNRLEINETGVFGGTSGFRLIDSTWNVNPLRLAGYYLWVGATAPNVGKLMIKAGAPTNDNDGTVVGSQS